MIKNFARFSGTLGKKYSGDNGEIEFKFTVPAKAFQENVLFLMSNLGEKINFYLGDPQMAMAFSDEEEDAMYQKFTGRYVTTDASGVVTKVEEKEEDENQTKLFDENGQPVIASEGQETGEGEQSEVTDQQDGEDTAEGATEGDEDLSDDLPEWMKDGSGPEMNFTDDGQGDSVTAPEDEEPPAGETEPGQDESEVHQETTGEITKEQIEEYILQQKPIFPDIELDFPQLVEKRRNGATWLKLAKELGIPSSQLSTKYSKYKNKVKDLMQGAGVA
jgi:hypothetical protein